MNGIKVGDIVARTSYGGDIPFLVVDIIPKERGKPIYVLKGMVSRIQADSYEDDLELQDTNKIHTRMRSEIASARKHGLRQLPLFRGAGLFRFRGYPGKVLHIDGDASFLQTCLDHYKEAGVRAVGRAVAESGQPGEIRTLLERYKPNILVMTGHDGIKKNSGNLNSVENYRNSKYFIQSVKEARKYEGGYDNLCIFAGACQSYYEGIMDAGANFASSPGRILINALDPAFVAEKVALTDSKVILTPKQISQVTISGSDGIWGINTHGQYRK